MRGKIFFNAIITVAISTTGILTACQNQTVNRTNPVTTDTSPTNTSSKTTSTTLDVPPAYPQVPQITVQELKKIMDEGAGVVIVDVRDPASYAYYHIPTAVNFFYDVNDDPMNMTMRLWSLPSNKLIVFYCN